MLAKVTTPQFGWRYTQVSTTFNLQATLKRYQTEHRSKLDSLEKSQAELKKIRRKSQGGRNALKYEHKEIEVWTFQHYFILLTICTIYGEAYLPQSACTLSTHCCAAVELKNEHFLLGMSRRLQSFPELRIISSLRKTLAFSPDSGQGQIGGRGCGKRRSTISITHPMLQMKKMGLRPSHMVDTWNWGLNFNFLVSKPWIFQ